MLWTLRWISCFLRCVYFSLHSGSFASYFSFHVNPRALCAIKNAHRREKKFNKGKRWNLRLVGTEVHSRFQNIGEIIFKAWNSLASFLCCIIQTYAKDPRAFSTFFPLFVFNNEKRVGFLLSSSCESLHTSFIFISSAVARLLSMAPHQSAERKLKNSKVFSFRHCVSVGAGKFELEFSFSFFVLCMRLRRIIPELKA